MTASDIRRTMLASKRRARSRRCSRPRARSGTLNERQTAADPDSRARSHLANERTFLAWLRTGLALIVLGLASAQFIDVDRELVPGIRAVTDFAAILIVSGALIVLIGGARYFRSRDQIDAARFQPAGPGIVAATALIMLLAAFSIALVFLLGR